MSENKDLNSGLNLLAKSSLIFLIGIVISKVLGYLFRIIVARNYGPEVYGLYFLAFTLVVWVSTIASLGLSDGLVRFISKFRAREEVDKIRKLIRNSTAVMLSLGVISAIILFLLSDFLAINIFHNEKLSLYIKIFSISIPFGLLSNIILACLRAFEKPLAYSITFNIVQNLTMVLVLVFLIFIGFNGESTAISFVASMCAMVISGSFFVRIYLKKYIQKPNPKTQVNLKSLYSYSLPLMFVGIIGSFLFLIDGIFIGYFLGIEWVGFYNAAVPIAALLTIAGAIFMEIFIPLINKAYELKNLNLIKELSKQVSKWIFFINVPAITLMILFPGVLINLLFGEEFLVAEKALQILSVGIFFQALSMVPSNLISMTGRSKRILVNTLFIGVFNCILNFLLIPKLGINGAAIGSSVSYAIFALALFIQAKGSVGIIPLRRKMFLIIISSMIAATVVFFVKGFVGSGIPSLISMAILFILICIIMFKITGSFDKEDKRIIGLIIRKMRFRK